MVCISKALIIGGSIAGISAVVALARVGVECDVVELVEVPLGASLAFSGRAAEVLVELGVYDDVRDTGTLDGPDSTATSLRDAAGRLINPGPRRPTWPGAVDGVAVYRPVFVDVMTDAAKRLGVNVRKGVTAQTIDDGEDAPTGKRVAMICSSERTASAHAPAPRCSPTRRNPHTQASSASVGWHQDPLSRVKGGISDRLDGSASTIFRRA